MNNLVKQLRIKADVVEMGEKIAWGSDTALMREASNTIEALEKQIESMKWISVKDRLPEVKHNFSDVFLVVIHRTDVKEEWLNHDDYTHTAQLHHTGIWLDMDGTPTEHDRFTKVTHWMELPSIEGLEK